MNTGAPWYYIVLFLVVEIVLLRVFDKYEIIKSKPLRYFIVFSSSPSPIGVPTTFSLRRNKV